MTKFGMYWFTTFQQKIPLPHFQLTDYATVSRINSITNEIYRSVCLLEKPLEHFQFSQALDKALHKTPEEDIQLSLSSIPQVLARQIPNLLKLMSSSRDRAVLQFVLASIYSNDSLRFCDKQCNKETST